MEPVKAAEPRFIEVPVTIVDVMFLGGVNETLMLTEQDRIIENYDRITVIITDPKDATKTLETITYHRRNMLAVKIRSSVYRKRDNRPIPPVAVEDVPSAD